MKALKLITLAVSLAFISASADAHVPYIERQDYSASKPFHVQDIEQSIALYAWLQTDGTHPSDDVDVATFVIEGPTRFYAELLVPACPSYIGFVPWFLVAGPGLSDISVEIPFALPEGYGAIVVPNVEPGPFTIGTPTPWEGITSVCSDSRKSGSRKISLERWW